MERNAFKSMSTEELWSLHERVALTLARKIAEEKAKLEARLRMLEKSNNAINLNWSRRAYPKVLPKYQNPKDPAETWSGRGKQQTQLKAGKKLEHFLIARSSTERRL
jgi:DNA-binding protein H-NS